MKLTEKDFGKCIRHRQWKDDTYAILTGIRGNSDIDYIKIENGKVMNNGNPINSGFHVSNPDLSYYQSREVIFEFTRFGCNAKIVKDLIEVLDERYTRKK